MYAGTHVRAELNRNLGALAEQRGLPAQLAWTTWLTEFEPLIHFVDVPDLLEEHPTVQAVSKKHLTDAPTAKLALLIGPSVVISWNKKHLGDVGAGDVPELATAARRLAEFDVGANATAKLSVAGYQGAASVVRAIRKLSPLGIALIVLVLGLGMLVLVRANEGPRELGKRIGAKTKELAPPVMREFAQILVLRDEAIAEFETRAAMVDAPGTLTNRVAHLLAVAPEPVSATKLAQGLSHFRVAGRRITPRMVREVLESYDCFVPISQRWQLGRRAGQQTSLLSDR